MAVTKTVNGIEVKERNPFGVWALSLVTLGIYYWVWYYKVNKEMRRTFDINVDPARACGRCERVPLRCHHGAAARGRLTKL